MNRISRIAIALSRTPPDVGLLAYSALVTKLLKPELVEFVHVVPEETKLDDSILHRMEDEVEYHFTRSLDGPEVAYRVVVGHLLDKLVEYTAQHQTHLLMLGHRKGRTGRRSLASRLAMVAPCPVWMVPEGSAIGIHQVLVPVDFSNHASLALEHAAVLAKEAHAQCAAMHVYFDSSSIQYEEHVKELREGEDERMAEFFGRVDRHGVSVRRVFEESSRPAQAILRKASEMPADLIVMGTRGRTKAAAVLLGSVAAQVIVQTPVPILIVKQLGTKMGVLDALLKRETWTADEGISSN